MVHIVPLAFIVSAFSWSKPGQKRTVLRFHSYLSMLAFVSTPHHPWNTKGHFNTLIQGQPPRPSFRDSNDIRPRKSEYFIGKTREKLLFWLVFCQLDTARVIWEKRLLTEKMVPTRMASGHGVLSQQYKPQDNICF